MDRGCAIFICPNPSVFYAKLSQSHKRLTSKMRFFDGLARSLSQWCLRGFGFRNSPCASALRHAVKSSERDDNH